MNVIKCVFVVWRCEVVKEKYWRAREREIESLCVFFIGCCVCKMVLVVIGVWCMNVCKCV